MIRLPRVYGSTSGNSENYDANAEDEPAWLVQAEQVLHDSAPQTMTPPEINVESVLSKMKQLNSVPESAKKHNNTVLKFLESVQLTIQTLDNNLSVTTQNMARMESDLEELKTYLQKGGEAHKG